MQFEAALFDPASVRGPGRSGSQPPSLHPLRDRRTLAPAATAPVRAPTIDRIENAPEIALAIPPLSPATVQRAEAGDAAARFALAEHDLAMAGDEPMRRRLRASARRGHPLAQTSLGVLDLAGDGVPLDRVEAHAGFALAAGQGEREALESAGTLRMELDEEALQRTRALAHQYARQPPRRAPVPLR